MDMYQSRVVPAATAGAVGTMLLAGFVAAGGAGADLGHSLPLIIVSVAVFVLPGCAAVAVNAWQSQARRARVEHREAMDVMRDVAPLEAESLPLAGVHSLTEAQVDRRQRDRRAAVRQGERGEMIAS